MPHWLRAPPATPVTIVAAYIEVHWIDCSRPVMSARLTGCDHHRIDHDVRKSDRDRRWQQQEQQ